MRVNSYGSGEKRVAIVGGTHGDEPRTAEAVDKFYNDLREKYSEDDLDGKAKFIIANEIAIDRGVRFTEADLNRSYPGDASSDIYEVSLAARITEELADYDAILSIHSSKSAPPEFAITSYVDRPVNRRTARYLPVNYLVDNGSLREDTMDSNLGNTVTIEAGHQGSKRTEDFAYESVRRFLIGHSIIPFKDVRKTETNLIKAVREIDKDHGEPNVYYDNFESVSVGNVIAEDDGIKHVARKGENIPILVSENGYENIFGLVGYNVGVLE